MSDSQPSWIGRQVGGRYQIETLLGRGGMSSVFQALDPNLQRTVAVKIIHPHLSEHPEFVKRFEQEAAAVAQLRHPNIIQVHDFNHQGDVYYMILEHVPGVTLERQLAEIHLAQKRIPLSETIHVMSKLCEAVHYAHQRNMIHRDLKPSNVIITPEGEPILMDFGIAKIVGGDHVHTATGATIGTAAYMAPEQVRGSEVDQRADIYSLGVILFELVSGRPPFEGKSAMTVMMKHLEEPVPDIRVLNTAVPDILVGILEKSLAKDPANRFNSALEIRDALQRVGSEAIKATAGSAPILRQTAVPTPPPITPQPEAQPALTNSPQPDPISPPAELPPPTPDTLSKPAKRRPIGLIVGALALIAIAAVTALLWPRFSTNLPTSANMVQIPAGTYAVGIDNGGSQTAALQQVTLETFWIDQYEVTNAAYAAFVEATNGKLPVGWSDQSGPINSADQPVQGVTWEMAADYCRWADKRLPTEAEWEAAARGTDGLLYPWGDERQLVTLPINGTYSVGTVPANRSAFNVYDMAGNVWEWVDEPYAAVAADQRILRGGSYDNARDLTYRLAGDPSLPTMQATAGFRCAASEVTVMPEDDLLVEDDFSNPESGWETWDDGSVLYGYHPPDYYHVQASSTETLSTAFFGGNFDDVTMESLVFVDATDTENGAFRYGLVLRRSGDNFYAFTIAPRANEWTVLKHTENGLTVLDQGTVETLQGLTGKDSLRVDASGSDFAFSINGRLVSQLSDTDLPQGDIGFMVQTFDESRAHIHYDRLTLREVVYQPSSTVIFTDDFTDPESGWPSVSEDAVLSGYHPPDYYHVQSSEPNHRSLAFFGGNLADFTMEADIFVDNTDTDEGDFLYGLVARRQGDDYYAFLLSPQSGEWQVVKQSSAGSELLATGNEPSVQGLSTINRLRVDAAGNNLIFHANGRPLVVIDDNSYAEGEIGFIVETLDQPLAHIHYDTFTLREVEADIDAAPTAVALRPTAEPTARPAIEATPEPTVTETPAPPIEANLPSGLDMVWVDGGVYSVDGDVTIALDPFWIDQFEVTNNQFSAYLQETGGSSEAIIGEANHPVRGVTWDEAAAFCDWQKKRLPSEAEWVVAARGPSGFLYPWGNEETAVSLPNSNTYPVGSIPQNRSVFGAFDLAGNVWEWVGTPITPIAEDERVLRGGANSFQQDLSQRLPGDPNSSVMIADSGFRCAATTVDRSETTTDMILFDDFANVESGWWQAREPVNNYFYGYHPTDFYHVQVSTAQGCLAVSNEFTTGNFMAEVQVFTASTDTETGAYRYGVTFREDDTGFYALTISPRSQQWQIFKSTSEGLELLAEGMSDTIQGDSQENRDRLFVLANEAEMSFFVNGELVQTVVDDTYTNGRIGFIVNTLDETYTHAHFDQIAVWPLPETVATPTASVTNSSGVGVTEPLCRGTVSADNTLLNFVTHTVTEGDTVSSIAAQYEISEAALMGANGRTITDPRLIVIGQVIIIPQG